MKIGALAQPTNTQTNTIRFYERVGLLPDAKRTDRFYQIYGDEHVDRLRHLAQGGPRCEWQDSCLHQTP